MNKQAQTHKQNENNKSEKKQRNFIQLLLASIL